MPRLNSPSVLGAGIALVILGCFALGALNIFQFARITPQIGQNRTLVVRTFDVITTAQSLDQALQDAERGQRSFLITEDPVYLAPYRRGIEAVPVLLSRLKQLSAQDPGQEQRLSALQNQIAYRLARLKDDLEIRQRDGFGAARRNVQTNGGLDSMRAISALINVTVADQNRLLTERLARAFEDEQNVGMFAKTGMLLTFAILVLGAGLIWIALRERARQQEALERANAVVAQAQKMETLGQLSGGIAHDFNNMLAVIKSGIELLRRRLKTTDPEALQFVDGIDGGANRAASLTQRLLAFSRRRPLAPKPNDPNRLVSGMSDILRRALGGGVVVETSLASRSWVSADPNQMENAILNLAVNARDAMPNGGRLKIRTADIAFDETTAPAPETVPAGKYVMIRVSDNGHGMTPEVMNRVFEPFFTTKEEGQGTGLGLSQIHGLVEQSAGHIRIASEVGKGTTVTLYLPVVAAG